MAVKAGGPLNPEPLTAYPPSDDEVDHLAEMVLGNFADEADRHLVDDGLAVLEILCGAAPRTAPDSPEFVDVAGLVVEVTERAADGGDVLELSDDEDDDVVFVTEYREAGRRQAAEVVVVDSDDSKGSDSRIRRNPVRTARSRTKGKAKDVLFEEDFAFLDSSEDELEKKENKPPDVRPSTSTSLPKEWPINVHERPEYNPATRRLEFDYLKAKGAVKKVKLDAAPTRRKPAKPMSRRRRKPVAVVERVPIEQLKPLVNSTTDMLKGYFVNSRKHKDIADCRSEICTFENKLEVLKNQALLFSMVNDLDENEVVEKFKLLNVDGDAKDAT